MKIPVIQEPPGRVLRGKRKNEPVSPQAAEPARKRGKSSSALVACSGKAVAGQAEPTLAVAAGPRKGGKRKAGQLAAGDMPCSSALAPVATAAAARAAAVEEPERKKARGCGKLQQWVAVFSPRKGPVQQR